MPRWALVVLFALLVGCSGSRQRVRLDTGQGEPRVHVARAEVEPIQVGDEEFQQAIPKHARSVPTPERSLELARRLFGVPERSGWYHYERKSRRVVPLGAQGELKWELSPAEAELNRLYLLWCGRAWGPPARDCLHLLVDSPVLDGDGKYALAMAIAQGAVLGEMKQAFGRMVNPEAVAATLTSAITVYLMLWLLPEPISKGVAALMTVGLVAYLGWDLVWKLIDGWRELVEQVDRATTFEEIRTEGLKFAQVMGDKGTKALVMLATLAVGNTAAGMAAEMPTLPGAGQASVVAEVQLNLRYSASALSQVESVAMDAEGVTVALAPGAVAMTARGNSGGEADAKVAPPSSGGPGEWVEADEYMSENSRNYQAQVTGAPKGYAYRVKQGDEEVDFDGFDQGVLLEVKGPGYEQWVTRKLDFLPNFKGRLKLLDQAKRQLGVAQGRPIRWIVAEEKLAGALKKMFAFNNLRIEVVHVPPSR
ncbi:MAG: Tox-REase-5 domain-containing protein [Hyalangium sp.]|uniref:SitA5 family polymorphic toxin n=1 Tax=Hyalangium sp. TaxID=2028555 RepID=UPI00389A6D10